MKPEGVGMLSKQAKLILALTCLPRVGKLIIRNILSSIEQQGYASESCFTPFLSTKNAVSINEFFNGQGSLSIKIANIDNAMHEHSISLITYLDAGFPVLLHEIPDCPLFLFYKGDLSAINSHQIAIVGSRNASPSGLRHAYEFADQLSINGFVVTSGLARGIDSAAHSAAVERCVSTVAVMGTGLDIIYPKVNQKLAYSILENGCWLSEYFPGSAPRAVNFPRRNRIISGLSLGVLVVEARAKSGTLITARMAIEQNRDVFAIPGSIDFLGSHGCHQLISDGAKLVQSVDDILQEYPDKLELVNKSVMLNEGHSNSAGELDEKINKLEATAKKVYNCIDYNAQTIEQVSILTRMSIGALSVVLIELELLGLIDNINGSFVRR